MPIYEFSCDDCGVEFEVLVRGHQLPTCPTCGSDRLFKQFSVPAAHSTSSTTGSSLPAIQGEGCGKPQCGMGGCGMM